MLWNNFGGNFNQNVFKNPQEFLVFGFNIPQPGLDWSAGTLAEAAGVGWAGTYLSDGVLHSTPQSLSLVKATAVKFDPSSTSVSGILMLVRANSKGVIVTRLAGGVLRYDLPKGAILINNTSGTLRQLAGGGHPATCEKRFYMGKARYTLIAGGANAGTVNDFAVAGFTVCTTSGGIKRSLLERNGFLTRTLMKWQFAFVPCGSGAANIVDMRSNRPIGVAAPPNTINFTFSTPATVDCQIIAEYSGPDGVWKPLAFTDQTDGFRKSGSIHFEPPPDWTESSAWDDNSDIGGGPRGSGPKSYWIRLQRRSATGGATTSAISVANYPYLVATREDDAISLPLVQSMKGKVCSFRFVPIAPDDTPDLNAALVINHKIAGLALA